MTVVEFLAARYAEDEALARAAGGDTPAGRWFYAPYAYGPPEDGWGEPEPEVHAQDGSPVASLQPHEGGGLRDVPTAHHIARFDPARVLADIAAKRAVLLLQARTHDYCVDSWYSCAQAIEYGYDDTPGSGCADEDRAGGPCDCGRDWLIDKTARILAAPYASHPDYQQEWTP